MGREAGQHAESTLKIDSLGIRNKKKGDRLSSHRTPREIATVKCATRTNPRRAEAKDDDRCFFHPS